MMPPEILHEIAFGAGQVYGGPCCLDAADVAALRATCRHLAFCFSPEGLDLEYWYALGGADWCVKKRRIRALELGLFRFGRPAPVLAYKAMALFCTRGRLRLVEYMLDNTEAPLYTMWSSRAMSALFGEVVKGDRILEARSGAYLAVKRGHTEVIRLILAHPRVVADLHRAHLCFTILLAAAERGAAEIAQIALEAGMCSVSSMNNLAARIAAERGHLEVLQLFLAEPRFNLTSGAKEALWGACKMNHPECISLILGSGWALQSWDIIRCLADACEKDNAEVVLALLTDPRADPNGNHRDRKLTPFLTKACQSGHKELAVALLSDPRTKPLPSALIAAIESEHFELVEAVLQPGLFLRDGRAVQRVYETALNRPDPSLLQIVLAVTPAVPTSEDFHMMTALVWYKHMMVLLEDGRVDPTVEDNLAIKLAAAWGRTDLVQALLSSGCDPTAEDCAAIRWAAEHGHVEIVSILAELSDPAAVQYAFEKLEAKKIKKK